MGWSKCSSYYLAVRDDAEKKITSHNMRKAGEEVNFLFTISRVSTNIRTLSSEG